MTVLVVLTALSLARLMASGRLDQSSSTFIRSANETELLVKAKTKLVKNTRDSFDASLKKDFIWTSRPLVNKT